MATLFLFVSATPAEEVALPGEQSTVPTHSELEDFYATQKVVRRSDWEPEPADKLYDDSCYNYFQSLKKKPVNPKRNKAYIQAMREVYSGGRIIIHDTETATPHFLSAHKARGYGDFAYHFIVSTPDCQIHEGRPLHMMGTHAGRYFRRDQECTQTGKYRLSNDFDFKAIGIAVVGSDPKGCQEPLKRLVDSLSRNLGVNKIGGHGHYQLPVTDCPEKNLARFLRNNFNAKTSPRLEGISSSGSRSLYNLVKAANGDSTSCSKYRSTIAYTSAQLNESLEPGQLPVNDLGPRVTCDKCVDPKKTPTTRICPK